MDVLDAHGLKAIFFVEALFACAVGLNRLREIVSMTRDRRHDIQLHIHTEWLSWMSEPILQGKFGQDTRDFGEDEKAILIGRALKNLRDAGASEVCAFRAGNYGINFETLRTLARLGIVYVSSYNYPFLGAACGLDTPKPFLQPRRIEGVYEFTITFYRDWPGHVRHLQLFVCSFHDRRGGNVPRRDQRPALFEG
jgi:hypothetical protein